MWSTFFINLLNPLIKIKELPEPEKPCSSSIDIDIDKTEVSLSAEGREGHFAPKSGEQSQKPRGGQRGECSEPSEPKELNFNFYEGFDEQFANSKGKTSLSPINIESVMEKRTRLLTEAKLNEKRKKAEKRLMRKKSAKEGKHERDEQLKLNFQILYMKFKRYLPFPRSNLNKFEKIFNLKFHNEILPEAKKARGVSKQKICESQKERHDKLYQSLQSPLPLKISQINWLNISDFFDQIKKVNDQIPRKIEGIEIEGPPEVQVLKPCSFIFPESEHQYQERKYTTLFYPKEKWETLISQINKLGIEYSKSKLWNFCSTPTPYKSALYPWARSAKINKRIKIKYCKSRNSFWRNNKLLFDFLKLLVDYLNVKYYAQIVHVLKQLQYDNLKHFGHFDVEVVYFRNPNKKFLKRLYFQVNSPKERKTIYNKSFGFKLKSIEDKQIENYIKRNAPLRRAPAGSFPIYKFYHENSKYLFPPSQPNSNWNWLNLDPYVFYLGDIEEGEHDLYADEDFQKWREKKYSLWDHYLDNISSLLKFINENSHLSEFIYAEDYLLETLSDTLKRNKLNPNLLKLLFKIKKEIDDPYDDEDVEDESQDIWFPPEVSAAEAPSTTFEFLKKRKKERYLFFKNYKNLAEMKDLLTQKRKLEFCFLYEMFLPNFQLFKNENKILGLYGAFLKPDVSLASPLEVGWGLHQLKLNMQNKEEKNWASKAIPPWLSDLKNWSSSLFKASNLERVTQKRQQNSRIAKNLLLPRLPHDVSSPALVVTKNGEYPFEVIDFKEVTPHILNKIKRTDQILPFLFFPDFNFFASEESLHPEPEDSFRNPSGRKVQVALAPVGGEQAESAGRLSAKLRVGEQTKKELSLEEPTEEFEDKFYNEFLTLIQTKYPNFFETSQTLDDLFKEWILYELHNFKKNSNSNSQNLAKQTAPEPEPEPEPEGFGSALPIAEISSTLKGRAPRRGAAPLPPFGGKDLRGPLPLANLLRRVPAESGRRGRVGPPLRLLQKAFWMAPRLRRVRPFWGVEQSPSRARGTSLFQFLKCRQMSGYLFPDWQTWPLQGFRFIATKSINMHPPLTRSLFWGSKEQSPSGSFWRPSREGASIFRYQSHTGSPEVGQFFEFRENINNYSWSLLFFFSSGWVFVNIFKNVYKKYAKEIVESGIDFLKRAGILNDVKWLKEELGMSDEQAYRGIRHPPKGKKFKNIIGLDRKYIILQLSEMVWFLKTPKSKFRKPTYLKPKGFLFTGPPGTGKTLLVQAIAGETGVPIVTQSGGLLQNPRLRGKGAQTLHKLFLRAREIAPCIIFIDEVDGIGSRRQFLSDGHGQGGYDAIEFLENNLHLPPQNIIKKIQRRSEFFDDSDPYWKEPEFTQTIQSTRIPIDVLQDMHSSRNARNEQLSILTQLLIELDGLHPLDNILVIGATNRVEILDPALMRPGRFQRILKFHLPDYSARINLLKLYTQSSKIGISKEIPWDFFSKRTQGLSSADIASIVFASELTAVQLAQKHTFASLERGIDLITSFPSDPVMLRLQRIFIFLENTLQLFFTKNHFYGSQREPAPEGGEQKAAFRPSASLRATFIGSALPIKVAVDSEGIGQRARRPTGARATKVTPPKGLLDAEKDREYSRGTFESESESTWEVETGKNELNLQEISNILRNCYYNIGKMFIIFCLQIQPLASIYLWERPKNFRFLFFTQKFYEFEKKRFSRIEIEKRFLAFFGGKAGESLFIFLPIRSRLCEPFKFESTFLSFANSLEQSNFGIENEIQRAQSLLQLMIEKWYFYLEKIATEKFHPILEDSNLWEYKDREKEILLAQALVDEMLIDLDMRNRLSRNEQKYSYQAWWMKKVATQLNFNVHMGIGREVDNLLWSRIYLSDPDNSPQNIEWVAPDEYFHTIFRTPPFCMPWTQFLENGRFAISNLLLLQSFNTIFKTLRQFSEFLDFLADYFLRHESVREAEFEMKLTKFFDGQI